MVALPSAKFGFIVLPHSNNSANWRLVFARTDFHLPCVIPPAILAGTKQKQAMRRHARTLTIILIRCLHLAFSQSVEGKIACLQW